MAYTIEETAVKHIVWDDNPYDADTHAIIENDVVKELVVTNQNAYNIINELNVDMLTHLKDVLTVVIAQLEPVEPEPEP